MGEFQYTFWIYCEPRIKAPALSNEEMGFIHTANNPPFCFKNPLAIGDDVYLDSVYIGTIERIKHFGGLEPEASRAVLKYDGERRSDGFLEDLIEKHRDWFSY